MQLKIPENKTRAFPSGRNSHIRRRIQACGSSASACISYSPSAREQTVIKVHGFSTDPVVVFALRSVLNVLTRILSRVNLSGFYQEFVVLPVRIELTTSPLPRECFTIYDRDGGAVLRPRGGVPSQHIRISPEKSLSVSRPSGNQRSYWTVEG